MTNTNEPLSIRDQLLLESYKEQTASWKHEDDILYKFGAVLLPVSFIALGVPYIKDIKEPSLTMLEVISTSGGMILMTFWFAFVCSSHSKISSRFQIINRIEENWEITGHKDIQKIRNQIFKPPKPFELRTHFLETHILYVYLLMAFILTLYRVSHKWVMCKSLGIVSSLPILIMWICLVIAWRYHCSIKRGEKRLEKLRCSQQS